MPTIKRTNTLAANAVVNPLVGSQYEYLPWDARVEFAVLADAGDSIAATIFSGSDVLMEDTAVDNKAVTDPIQYPYDVQVTDVAVAGERLNVTVRDVSGLGGTVRTQVWITPL